MSPVYYCYEDSPVGRLLMLCEAEKLTHLDFVVTQVAPRPDWILDENRPLFLQVKQALRDYFARKRVCFGSIPFAPKGTAFQQRVWSTLQQLAYGESTTYGELAQRIGQPKAVRAVGGAVGRNPISILIPCHRVLGKQRELTGFGGGLPIKRHLLQLEQIDYVDHGVEFVKPKHLKKYQQK